MDSISTNFDDTHDLLERFIKQRNLEVLWTPGESVHEGFLISIGDRRISSINGMDLDLIRSRRPEVQAISEIHFLEWREKFGGQDSCVELAICNRKYDDLQLKLYKERLGSPPNIDTINELSINLADVQRSISKIHSEFIEQIQCIAHGIDDVSVQVQLQKMALQSCESRLKSFTTPIASQLQDRMSAVKSTYSPDDISKLEMIKSRVSIAIDHLKNSVEHTNRDINNATVGYHSIDMISECLHYRLSDFNRLAVENDWNDDTLDKAINIYLYNNPANDVNLASFKETPLYEDFVFKTEKLRLQNEILAMKDNSKNQDPDEDINRSRKNKLSNH